MIGPLLLVLQAAAVQIPQDAPFEAPQVAETVLAGQRGGIRLPSGIDVALSIDTTTALDGRIVLQTVTKIDQGAPVTRVYTPADGQPVSLAGEGGSAVAVAAPTVTYDRQNGIRITGGPAVPVSLSSNSAAGSPPAVAEGLQAIDSSNPVTTDNGVVQQDMAGVSLQGTDIRIVHLTGEAFGSAIANSGNDRAIDTLTTLSVDLSNAGPDVLGSAMLRVESVGIDAMAMRY